MKYFALNKYDGELISEEEFIYDGLNNESLYLVLRNSLRKYGVESDDDDDSDNEQTKKEAGKKDKVENIE